MASMAAKMLRGQQTPAMALEILCADLPVSLKTQLHHLDFNAPEWQDLLPVLVDRIVEYGDTDKAIDALGQKFKWPEGFGVNCKEDRHFATKVKKELKSRYVMRMCNDLTASFAGVSLSDLSSDAVSTLHKVILETNVFLGKTRVTSSYDVVRDGITVLAPAVLQLTGDAAFGDFQKSTMDLTAFQSLVTTMVQSIEKVYTNRAKQVPTKRGRKKTAKQAIEGDNEDESAASKAYSVEKMANKRRKVHSAQQSPPSVKVDDGTSSDSSKDTQFIILKTETKFIVRFSIPKPYVMFVKALRAMVDDDTWESFNGWPFLLKELERVSRKHTSNSW